MYEYFLFLSFSGGYKCAIEMTKSYKLLWLFNVSAASCERLQLQELKSNNFSFRQNVYGWNNLLQMCDTDMFCRIHLVQPLRVDFTSAEAQKKVLHESREK